jgi:hypothetical protein
MAAMTNNNDSNARFDHSTMYVQKPVLHLTANKSYQVM